MSQHDQDEHQRILTFKLGQELFGITLLKVREVLGHATIRPVPRTPSYFKGMMDLRGKVIGVIDFREKLGTPVADTSTQSLMIIDHGSSTIGVIVDSIESVLTLTSDEIQEAPSFASEIDPRFVAGVYHDKDRLILMLDVERAVSEADLQFLKAS